MRRRAPKHRVVVVGAGIGGIAAALRLAAAGCSVLVLEASDAPGGKLRQVRAGGRMFDAGPTVLTMKWVFDDLLKDCGTCLDDELALEKADLLARHYWRDGACLDLHADPGRNVEAIRAFAGDREAEGFQRFAADSRRVFDLLKTTFIDATRPNPVSLSWRIGMTKPGALFALKPFSTLWSVLGDYFSDPRLKQLFARYATYCGSSPYLAPATLMLVAHVEQTGVWIPKDGMHALARRLVDLAAGLGVEIRYAARVETIVTAAGGTRVAGVSLSGGETVPAEQVVFNGDVAALAQLLGRPERPRRGGNPAQRSQSALVVCAPARPQGVPLAHHTVFFSDAYEAEFDAVFERRAPPDDPTVYVCAQDRTGGGVAGPAAATAERIYCLMNLPADGDRHDYSESELDRCLTAMDRRLAANGLVLRRNRQAQVLSAPDLFDRLYPATGGALYGRASHGWMASFNRPGARAALQGLYLAGGSVHPGPGVPMAALSGKIAADCLLADLASTGRFRPAATAGGMRTRPATADSSR
ncbi:1-hydroxycarotenoid 3,4-desaturase CrtD [Nitratireductor alexandrii]|uniref:1-hydroxycarotenoid 3,4-desaturase CrtD n=1 Tax=Nitratireductor alexandrii TaxID=2448161 RepID=UPI000FD74024|nr:1-hydroxycarotenoid 3,4-desaturase CrtD [Nitratireductor alexandrii]